MASSAPRTSVIMPVYKTADRVVASIQSVLAQSDPDFELLVLIDASPDDAAARIADFLEQNPDSRVRVFDNPVNRGVSAVRNQGLDAARGSWVAFLDSDDSFDPLFLERMHGAVAAEGCDIAVCAHTLVELDGGRRQRHRGEPGVVSGEQAALELLRDQRTPYLWDKLFRASTVEGLRFAEDIHRAEDALLVLGALTRAQKVVQVAEAYYNYTVDTGGLTWGKVTPVAESLRLMSYMREAASHLVQTKEGQAAFDVSWVLTFLNNAQQGLMSSSAEGSAVISECRAQITWRQLVSTLRAGRPVFAAAGALLKVSPGLYRALYGAYVKRMYGI